MKEKETVSKNYTNFGQALVFDILNYLEIIIAFSTLYEDWWNDWQRNVQSFFPPSNYLPIQEGQQEFFALIRFLKLITSQAVLNSYT